jgi:UDP-glucose 4-epimerase
VESLNGRTILITGANGFLGRHLLGRLSQEPVRVHAISRSQPSSPGTAQWAVGDITDVDWFGELVVRIRPDVIYQLASASIGAQDAKYVLPTFENDLRTTVNTLTVARETGCRVIITRSLDEPEAGTASGPPSPYAAAKAASGLYGRMFHQLYSLPVVMLRPFMTYGPWQKNHKIVPYTIQSMLSGKPPELASGTRRLDWIYVSDVITAFLAAATRVEAVGKEIDLGTGSLVSIREVVEEIQRLIPGAPAANFGSLPDRANERIRIADMATAEETLGWRPVTSLTRGLSETIACHRQR